MTVAFKKYIEGLLDLMLPATVLLIIMVRKLSFSLARMNGPPS
jgi:hypothetical protein